LLTTILFNKWCFIGGHLEGIYRDEIRDIKRVIFYVGIFPPLLLVFLIAEPLYFVVMIPTRLLSRYHYYYKYVKRKEFKKASKHNKNTIINFGGSKRVTVTHGSGYVTRKYYNKNGNNTTENDPYKIVKIEHQDGIFKKMYTMKNKSQIPSQNKDQHDEIYSFSIHGPSLNCQDVI